MDLQKRIDALVYLGQQLEEYSEPLEAAIQYTHLKNAWFTLENIDKALQSIRTFFLQKEKLHEWLSHYQLVNNRPAKTVALVLAGNIPLVGFHDVMSVFLVGHRAQVKLSEKDKVLLPYLVKMMAVEYPEVTEYFDFTERLKDYDAVIATGSNNSSRYFESYFSSFPHIIRKNRNAVAVLTGKETVEQLRGIAIDVFTYFGLGCRNVSKLYLPKDYNFDPLLTEMHEHKKIVLHTKYKNNFDYNYALIILNKIEYKANGCILMIEDPSLQSRIASLHFEYYTDAKDLAQKLESKREEIQCVVSANELEGWQVVAPGEAQKPGLMDYADGVDTVQFLNEIF